MRLWHKDLVSYLPTFQAKNLWHSIIVVASIKTPRNNTYLVNRAFDYSIEHLLSYAYYFCQQNDAIEFTSWRRLYLKFFRENDPTLFEPIPLQEVFQEWHNDRYLKQCLYALQEKYDGGILSKEEWELIESHFGDMLK